MRYAAVPLLAGGWAVRDWQREENVRWTREEAEALAGKLNAGGGCEMAEGQDSNRRNPARRPLEREPVEKLIEAGRWYAEQFRKTDLERMDRIRERDAALARDRELERALGEYGDHSDHCRMVTNREPCNCGWDAKRKALLARSAAAEEPSDA